MKQISPTYMGYSAELGMWAFSPSPIRGAEIVYDISEWTWDDVQDFMTQIPESEKLNWLSLHEVKVFGEKE